MSLGQSLRNGSSVEPGLPNTFLMSKARSRSRVACFTVTDFVLLLPFLATISVPCCLLTPPAPLVIASAAKQSRLSPRKDTGLLRSARNDEERLSPHRRALHRRLPFRVRGPQLHALAAVIGVDGKFRALEQRLEAAIRKLLRRFAGTKLGRHLDDERRLQRSVEDQARIALDLGDVVAVVVDAVAVEGQRGIAEQQHGIGDMGLAVLRLRRRGRGLCGRGLPARDLAIDDVLSLADGCAARRGDAVLDRDEAQRAGRAG